MNDVSGPTSSLPGSRHPLPAEAMCDDHPDRSAVARVQGETDSFGAEYYDMCEECLARHKAFHADPDNSLGTCEWCKARDVRVRPHRDYEEGSAGRVYDVCDQCITRENKRLDDEWTDIPDYEMYGEDIDE